MPATKPKPKHWWLIGLVAVIIAFATIFVATALTNQWGYEIEATTAANRYADSSDSHIKQVCIPGPTSRLDDCVTNARDVSRQNQRAEYELEAQRTAALWTAVMGWVSALAVALSAIGVYLIYRTFRQTQEQAADMERSVNEAARSAEAMEGVARSMSVNATQIVESVRHQRQFGRMQMRAYVSGGCFRTKTYSVERIAAHLRNNFGGNRPAQNGQTEPSLKLCAEFISASIIEAPSQGMGLPKVTAVKRP